VTPAGEPVREEPKGVIPSYVLGTFELDWYFDQYVGRHFEAYVEPGTPASTIYELMITLYTGRKHLSTHDLIKFSPRMQRAACRITVGVQRLGNTYSSEG
jgi:hypothetical protein